MGGGEVVYAVRYAISGGGEGDLPAAPFRAHRDSGAEGIEFFVECAFYILRRTARGGRAARARPHGGRDEKET